MSATTNTAPTNEQLAGESSAPAQSSDTATRGEAGSAAAAAAAAAALESSTDPAERDHIERDVSNILAGLNQEQLASIVAAARASEARNSDGAAPGESFAEGSNLPLGLGQAASALTSIASGFKRTPGNDRTNLGTEAAGKDLGDAPPPPGYEESKDLDSATIAAVKSATDNATAAALASLGSLAASNPTQQDDAEDSMDYDSPTNGDSPNRGIKRSRGPELDRQRKDNHKEVERRRRSAINDGIVSLSHIVPGCDAKNTNKGAIIHAAVRYIQDLKHNEASNIEKWTLEKLLMDQAMGDLTAQLDEATQQVERLRQELEERYAQQDKA
ncbi:Centromere-binding protein 1 [Pseudozyma hubeiensis]|nr:Centromere-binding protein 1 [Pseudozyma hubeiensis]